MVLLILRQVIILVFYRFRQIDAHRFNLNYFWRWVGSLWTQPTSLVQPLIHQSLWVQFTLKKRPWMSTEPRLLCRTICSGKYRLRPRHPYAWDCFVSLLSTFSAVIKSDRVKTKWQEKWKHCLMEKIKWDYETAGTYTFLSCNISKHGEKTRWHTKCQLRLSRFGMIIVLLFFLFAYLYFLIVYNEHALLLQKRKNRYFQPGLLKWTDSQAA